MIKVERSRRDIAGRSEARGGAGGPGSVVDVGEGHGTAANAGTQPASAQLPSRDLENIYALFLGVSAKGTRPDMAGYGILELLAAIFASNEFRTEVLAKVLLRQELSAERFPGAPPFRLIEWAQQVLPIEPATGRACGSARSWLTLLEVLLADATMGTLAPEFAEAGVTAILRDRVVRDPDLSLGYVIPDPDESVALDAVRFQHKPKNRPSPAPKRASRASETRAEASTEAEETPDPLARVLSSESLANAYALFLGRAARMKPSDLLGLDLPGLLSAIFSSDEFRNEVLKPVLLRESLPAERFSGAPPFRLIDWAQHSLPIERKTSKGCGAARTWSALLEVLLADARLGLLSAEFSENGITSSLARRVAQDPELSLGRGVTGAIEEASAFEVRGWAVDISDKTTPVTLEFLADGESIGSVLCDQPRPDLAEVLGGSGAFGFSFRIPAVYRSSFAKGCTVTAVDTVLGRPMTSSVRVYGEAAHEWDGIASARREIVQLRETLQRLEAQLPELHRMSSLPLEAYGDYWERFYRPVSDVLGEQRAKSGAFAYRPLISIVIPAFESDAFVLDKAVQSVLAQTYTNWELIVTDDASADPSDLELVQRRHASEDRIRWVAAKHRGGIAKNTNRGIAASKGDYVAFLDHDDELAPDALHCALVALQEQQFSLVYSDEDHIEENEYGRCVHHTPVFKPDFDPDMLLAMNYIGHLVMVKREVLRGIGGFRSGIDGAQDHDLLLRLSARLPKDEIRHIPRVLYHTRGRPGSMTESSKSAEALRKTIVAVVDSHLRECGHSATVEEHNDPIGQPRPFTNRIRWRLPVEPPKVSVIVPTRDRLDLLEPCVASILQTAPVYPGELELLIVDNDSTEESTLGYFRKVGEHPSVRIMRHGGGFNWSAINNAAARVATGEILIFLNSDTRVLTPSWCNELVANAVRPEVGAVGARLLYQDGTIQHAGVVVGVEGVAGHEGVGDLPSHGGYLGRNHVLRAAAAVTGACLATRRAVFLGLGEGFDELQLKVAYNDVDFCMRLRDAGYRVIYTPFAVMHHLEAKSRGRDLSPSQQARYRSEALTFRARWGDGAVTDPYFNPHFERFARPFDRLRPPPQAGT